MKLCSGNRSFCRSIPKVKPLNQLSAIFPKPLLSCWKRNENCTSRKEGHCMEVGWSRAQLLALLPSQGHCCWGCSFVLFFICSTCVHAVMGRCSCMWWRWWCSLAVQPWGWSTAQPGALRPQQPHPCSQHPSRGEGPLLKTLKCNTDVLDAGNSQGFEITWARNSALNFPTWR